MKAAYVARLSRRSVASVGATVMARLVGFAVLLGTALLVSVLASIAVAHYPSGLTLLLAALSLLYVAAVLLLTRGESLARLAFFQRSSIGRWVMDAARNVAFFMRRGPTLARAVLLSLLFYASLNLSYYFFGQAVGLRAGFWFYWVAVPILSVVTLLPISLNGYGLREATAIALFRLTGDSAATALSLALVVEVQLLLFALIGALVQPRPQPKTRLSSG